MCYYLRSKHNPEATQINQSFQSEIKENILELPMPKFIWIAEICNKALMKQRKAAGLVILDATEANVSHNKPLIMAAFQDHYITLQPNGHSYQSSLFSPARLSDFDTPSSVFLWWRTVMQSTFVSEYMGRMWITPWTDYKAKIQWL